jgi:hypothetical protein
LNLYQGGTLHWHLGFLNAAMVCAKGYEEGHVLFGAYPKERDIRVEPALQRAVKSSRGRVLPRSKAHGIWEQRFFPATTSGSPPTSGRTFVQGAHLAPTLVELERKLARVAIQGTVTRMGGVAFLAFDPAYGDSGLLGLSAATDIKLLRMASRSWMPRRR